MKLHFDAPIDTTKSNGSVYEFEPLTDITNTSVYKIKGKSLSRLIEEKKISKRYKNRKVLNLQLKNIETLIVIAIVVITALIIFMLSRIT